MGLDATCRCVFAAMMQTVLAIIAFGLFIGIVEAGIRKEAGLAQIGAMLWIGLITLLIMGYG